jgi:outer membrane receptor protein involved in Fe transport
LSVRGSGSDEVSFNLNGFTLRSERSNSPFTGISITSIENVQVQTGGFSAEYGNLRSGLIM